MKEVLDDPNPDIESKYRKLKGMWGELGKSGWRKEYLDNLKKEKK